MPDYITHQAAANTLPNAVRILVIGCSGGGKSTLSQRISKTFDLEYLSIDRDVRWLPGWQVRDRQQQREILAQLVQRDCWVMDGSGNSTFDIRLPRAKLVIWVRVPRYRAFIGLARRVWRYFGTTRPEMAEGCPEPLPDMEFLSYIWNFEKRECPRFIKNLDLYGADVPVVIVRSYAEMERLFQAR